MIMPTMIMIMMMTITVGYGRYVVMTRDAVKNINEDIVSRIKVRDLSWESGQLFTSPSS